MKVPRLLKDWVKCRREVRFGRHIRGALKACPDYCPETLMYLVSAAKKADEEIRRDMADV